MFSISDSGRLTQDDDATVGIKSLDMAASAVSVVMGVCSALLTTMFFRVKVAIHICELAYIGLKPDGDGAAGTCDGCLERNGCGSHTIMSPDQARW